MERKERMLKRGEGISWCRAMCQAKNWWRGHFHYWELFSPVTSSLAHLFPFHLFAYVLQSFSVLFLLIFLWHLRTFFLSAFCFVLPMWFTYQPSPFTLLPSSLPSPWKHEFVVSLSNVWHLPPFIYTIKTKTIPLALESRICIQFVRNVGPISKDNNDDFMNECITTMCSLNHMIDGFLPSKSLVNQRS